jgi:branched-chain amino acid transport system ATP-binding protein
MSAQPLACRGLRVAYGRIVVCHGIDLDVAQSEIVALLGPNGAGKSSFLGGLAGLVKTAGEVRVAARRIDGMNAHRRARAGIALVPEGRGNCFATLSVRDNLLIGAQLAPERERDAALDHVLGLFPVLRGRLAQEAGTLSGGEQQMLAIGMALARRPALLLLDEPSQGLAPTILHALREVFEELRALRVGIVIAEQNHAFAADVADRYVVMAGGALVAAGTRAELHRDALAAAYLTAGEHNPTEVTRE